jgi:hypothetical protein
MMTHAFPIPYPIGPGGKAVPIHHFELIQLRPLGEQETWGGDSGTPVVLWLDDERATFVGMHIAGGDGFSYVIPAWQLFFSGNYFGPIDDTATIRPVG